MKDDKLYLIHILECIERVQQYTKEGRVYFFADTKTQDAVIRNLQTLAESAQRISPVLKSRHKEVDWRNIGSFRNVAVHDYLGIDQKQIWAIVEQDLPGFKRQVQIILSELGDGE